MSARNGSTRASHSLAVVLLGFGAVAAGQTVRVSNDAELRAGIRRAAAGTTISLAPGVYRGGVTVNGLRGTADRPIVIGSVDPQRPAVFRGGKQAMHLGPNTAPQTFRFHHNAWFSTVGGSGQPTLPSPETAGVYGVDPKLADPGAGTMRATSDDPRLAGVGADAYTAP